MAEMETKNGKFKTFPGPCDVPHPRKFTVPPFEVRLKWETEEVKNFFQFLEESVQKYPSKPALSWVEENGQISQSFTYAEFDAKSRAIAATMLDSWKVKNGDRVVLVYPPGLEFLVAFVACLHAGAIAVPSYPPNPNDLTKDLPKLTRLVADSEAKLVLTSKSYYNVVLMSYVRCIRWPGEVWKTTDGIKPFSKPMARIFPPPASPVAFLQYTSGSTADPKGVMVAHSNIGHHLTKLPRAMRFDENTRFLSWLPQYHDLGLIVAYMITLSTGASGFYMSPITFIKRPSLWVQFMSRFKITHTAAPNFALELCTRKFNAEKDAPDGLDLSSLEFLMNAAEPVRAESMEKWNAAFSRYGWQPSAMCPCYGLAEHVVGVSAWGSKVIYIGEGKKRHRVHSSGQVEMFVMDGRMALVNPDTHVVCKEGEEGEIWLRSHSVALGYWKKEELSKETFHAKMAPGAPGSDDGEYLRTGDLAIIVEGEMFVTGRIKDLIIIRGRNYYPQDVERTAEVASEHVRAGCVAAFAIKAGAGAPSEEETVAIVAEVRSAGLTAGELAAVTADIRKAVVGGHGIVPSTIALIAPRTIPKTTSGKIRRKETSSKLTLGALKILNKDCCSLNAAALQEERRKAEAAEEEELSSAPEQSVSLNTSELQAIEEKMLQESALESAKSDASLPQEAEVDKGAEKWDGKTFLEAVTTMMGIQGQELKPEEDLVALGLTSMTGIDIIELIEHRRKIVLEPEQLQTITIGDLQALDDGADLAAMLKIKDEQISAMNAVAMAAAAKLAPMESGFAQKSAEESAASMAEVPVA